MAQQQQLPNTGINNEKNEYGLSSDSFPVGYRFIPLDKELLLDYLLPKINGSLLHPNFIHHDNIFNQTPDHLAEHYKAQGEKIWYFFTQREMSNKGGIRTINQKDSDGYWKDMEIDKTIMNDEDETIGVRKTLVYYKGQPGKGDQTDWIMQEFEVDSKLLQKRERADKLPGKDIGMEDDYVLCRIYKIADGIGKYRKDLSTDDEMSDNEIYDDDDDDIDVDVDVGDEDETNDGNQPLNSNPSKSDDHEVNSSDEPTKNCKVAP